MTPNDLEDVEELDRCFFDVDPTQEPENPLESWESDDEFRGNRLKKTKADGVERFIFQAKHGYQLAPNGGDILVDLEIWHKLRATYVGITEHNIDTLGGWAKKRINNVAQNSSYDHCKLYPASSQVPRDHDWKPGGTMTMIADDLSGRLIETRIDDMGRWVVHKFGTREGRVVTVIVTYQVGPKRAKDMKEYSFITQQESMLREAGK